MLLIQLRVPGINLYTQHSMICETLSNFKNESKIRDGQATDATLSTSRDHEDQETISNSLGVLSCLSWDISILVLVGR